MDPALRRKRILIDLLADKWTLLVLGSLCDSEGSRRFNAIRRDIPDMSQRSLIACLRRLERNGLVERHVIDGPQLGVEYRLTELGFSLDEPVMTILRWTATHEDKVRAAQTAYDIAKESERETGQGPDASVQGGETG